MYGMGVRNVLMLFALGDLFGVYGIMAYAFAISSSTNSEYVLAAMKRVAKVDALGLGGRERQGYLRRAGGVSAVAGTLAGISLVVLAGLTIYGLFLMAP